MEVQPESVNLLKKETMLLLQDITYIHPDKEILFSNINFVVNKHEKIALVGNNGSGKSTLLKIISGIRRPSSGRVDLEGVPYYVPQVFGQYDHMTISEAIGVYNKLVSLYEILKGSVEASHYETLDDDWDIEARCRDVLNKWGLGEIDLNDQMDTLSGGQKTKVFLAGIEIHQPDIILMDEPSNHLDIKSRSYLYNFIEESPQTLIVVSHDRALLDRLPYVCELGHSGIKRYGGNFSFYLEQKDVEKTALQKNINNKEKALKDSQEKERLSMERQQKLDARAKKNLGKAGLPKIVANTWKNNAENSTAKAKEVHKEKRTNLSAELRDLKNEVPDIDRIVFSFHQSNLHLGKIIAEAKKINHRFRETNLWRDHQSFQVRSGDRIVMKGDNGVGKTTLIKIILGDLKPSEGIVKQIIENYIYIDQEYSIVNTEKSVYQLAETFNVSNLEDHIVKTRLVQFLFNKDTWNKPCATLSGGERMRLLLCCLNLMEQAIDVIVLDEPTNNLDLQNIGILIKALREYSGTLIVVSHDIYFLENIGITHTIELQ